MSGRMIELDEGDEAGSAELELAPSDYPWTEDLDEWRRCFVLTQMGNADIHGPVLIENMQAVVDWLKNGKLPVPSATKKPGR